MTPELGAAVVEMRLYQTDQLLAWLTVNHPQKEAFERALGLVRSAWEIVHQIAAVE